MGTMSESAGCVGTAIEQTYLDGTINRMASTTSSLYDAGNKLDNILIKLRGSVPVDCEKKNEVLSPVCIMDQINVIQDVHLGLLNVLHNQINELIKLI